MTAQPAMDLDAPADRLEAACDAGDAMSCAWLMWTHEAQAKEPAHQTEAKYFGEKAALSHAVFDLGACEGVAARECTGIETGMSCCDRGILGCPEGCESDCEQARAAARAHTVDVLESACTAG